MLTLGSILAPVTVLVVAGRCESEWEGMTSAAPPVFVEGRVLPSRVFACIDQPFYWPRL